jgi:hypothetical protein
MTAPLQVHHNRFAVVSYLVPVDQFASTPRFDFAVDSHLAALNDELGLTAGIDQPLPFQEGIQFNVVFVCHWS